ncbi:MAG: hypothetical protein HC909_01070 [Blastochloris sp.]|nr:hypothetical protein [Blastochloris sp.]
MLTLDRNNAVVAFGGMMDSRDVFCAEIIRDIDRAYAVSANRIGWRFLASPAETLDGAEVAFIGLNPGGSHEPPDHPRFCVSCGSAYADERWGNFGPGQAPLQRQVLALFEMLGEKPDAVLAGNLVPFRSPNWSTLTDKETSLEFGRQLWTRVLRRAKPKLIVGMGEIVFKMLSQIVIASQSERIPVGWDAVRATRARFDGGIVVGLPHLSRFPIVTRPSSSAPLRYLLTPFVENVRS